MLGTATLQWVFLAFGAVGVVGLVVVFSRGATLPKVKRDSAMFVGGLLVIAHETLLGGATERPQLLVLAATMCGLPAFIHRDEKARSKKDPEATP